MLIIKILNKPARIEWQGNIAKTMVFCEGVEEAKIIFPELTFRNAKSHIIELKCNQLPNQMLFNHGFCYASKKWTLHVWCQHILA